MKIVIYTANIGNYDDFKPVNQEDKSVRYILYTDNKIVKSKTWEICHPDFIGKIPEKRKLARFIKINPHLVLPHHDISIWIDHCFFPEILDTNDFLNHINFDKENIMCFKHDWRDCIYEEGNTVIKDKLDDPTTVEKQLSKYRKEKYPKNLGLFSTGFMVRKNNDIVNKFNDLWWNEVESHSGRDQLSQKYASWKIGVDITQIKNLSVYDNPWISKKIKHSKKWSI